MVLLCNGNEISWVRSYLGTNQFGYEPVWLRTCLVTKSPDFIYSIASSTSIFTETETETKKSPDRDDSPAQ